MVLDGEFSYENENQRALPFSVKIQEISEAMRVHTGSTSNTHPADGWILTNEIEQVCDTYPWTTHG